jgi:hypothetical protein
LTQNGTFIHGRMTLDYTSHYTLAVGLGSFATSCQQCCTEMASVRIEALRLRAFDSTTSACGVAAHALEMPSAAVVDLFSVF